MNKKDLDCIFALYKRGFYRRKCIQIIIETAESPFKASQAIEELMSTLLLPTAEGMHEAYLKGASGDKMFGTGEGFAKDPVFLGSDGWYFFDETQVNTRGPFPDEHTTRVNLRDYWESLNYVYKTKEDFPEMGD